MSWLRAVSAGLIMMCAAAMPAAAQVDPNPNGNTAPDCSDLDPQRIGAPRA
ncbi:MAG: hypothetical protein HC855_16375 [Rhizobiales bacterium]|nr:hypothetical protein [Hyphomicrobiales bacterium]